jgi:hypothetical protein
LRLISPCLACALAGGLAAPALAGSEDVVVAGVEATGSAPYPSLSRGLRLGYRPEDRYEIQLTYVESQRDVLLSHDEYKEYALRLAHQLIPLVHCGYGLALRDVTLDYDVFITDQADEKPVHEHAQAVAANAFLGLQTTAFNTVTVGSDLFTISVPLRWLKHDGRFPDDAAELEDDPKTFPYVASAFKTNMQFLRTYVEVRF